MGLHYAWKQPATSRPWAVFRCLRFAFLSSVCRVLVNVGVSILLALKYRTSEPYNQWEPWDFLLFKQPSEELLTWFGCLIPWCWCFVTTFLEVSFTSEPAKHADPIIPDDLPAAAEPATYTDSITPDELPAADVVSPPYRGAEAAAGGAGLVGAEEPRYSNNENIDGDDGDDGNHNKNNNNNNNRQEKQKGPLHWMTSATLREREDFTFQGEYINVPCDDATENNVGMEGGSSTLSLPPRLNLEPLNLATTGIWTAIESVLKATQCSSGETSTSIPSSEQTSIAALGQQRGPASLIRPEMATTPIRSPVQAHIAVLSQGQPCTAAPSPNQAPTTVTSLEQASSDSSFRVPSTPSRSPRSRLFMRSPRRRLFMTSPTRARSWPRSGVDTMASPTPTFSPGPSRSLQLSPSSLPNDGNSEWDGASRPITPVQESGTSSPRSPDIPVYENATPSPRAPVPGCEDRKPPLSRVTYKELLLEEVQRWGHYSHLEKLKHLMHYGDDDEYSYIPEPEELRRERKRYEGYARNCSLQRDRPFHVYGTEELFAHDRLRFWVKLRMHLDPATPFPPGYTPVTDESDILSVAGTLYSRESNETESSDSDSGTGRGE